MIYVTSDLHFGHGNIIKLANRPFLNLHEMEKTLIENWNNKVKKHDTVYVLGDFSMKIKKDRIEEILKQLNGTIILIKGNHDNPKDIKISYDYLELCHNKFTFVMFHYPIADWNGKYRDNYIHLHGHTHSSEKFSNLPYKRYNVSVEANNYTPILLDDIIKEFENEEISRHK